MRPFLLPVAFLAIVPVLLSSCSAGGSVGKWRSEESMLKPAMVIEMEGERISVPPPDASLDKLIDDEIEDPNLSRGRFSELFAKALVKVRPGFSIVKCDSDEITLRKGTEEPQLFFVQNAWMICENVAGQRKERMRAFLSDNFDYSKGADPVRAKVVPVVRSPALLVEYKTIVDKADSDDLAAGKKPVENSLYSRPIAPGLITALVEDSPYSMRSISVKDMSKLKIKESDITNELLHNLYKRLPNELEINGADVLSLRAGGDYESSLILSNEVMGAVKKKVKGKLIFSVPNRNTVLFTGDASPSSVAKIREYTEDSFATEPRAISSLLYSWDNGKIEQYK